MSERKTSPEEAAYLAECKALPGVTFDQTLAILSRAYRGRFDVRNRFNPRMPEARSADVRFYLEDHQRGDLWDYSPLFFRFVEEPQFSGVVVEAEWHETYPRNMMVIQDGLQANASSYMDLSPLQKSAEALAAGRGVEKACGKIHRAVLGVFEQSPTQLSEVFLGLINAGVSIEMAIKAITDDGKDIYNMNYPTMTKAMLAARLKDEIVVKGLDSLLPKDERKDRDLVRFISNGLIEMGFRNPREKLHAALKTARWDDARIAAATALPARP